MASIHLEREAELANHLENRAKRVQEQKRNKPNLLFVLGHSSRKNLDYELDLAQKILAKAISVGGTSQSVLERSSFLRAASAPLIFSGQRRRTADKLRKPVLAVKTWTLRSKIKNQTFQRQLPQLSADISLSPRTKAAYRLLAN